MTAPAGRYPPETLKADYLRTALGLAATVGPLALAGGDAHPLVAVPLAAGAALFGWLGGRTLLRGRVRYVLRPDGLAVDGSLFSGLLAWDRVTDVRLRYYSVKKDRSGGWMQLTLRAGSRRHSIESQLTGFDTIAARVAAMVVERNLPVDETTRENFLSLGHYM